MLENVNGPPYYPAPSDVRPDPFALSATCQIPTMPTVTFVNEKKSIEVPEGANLRTQALRNGISLYPGPHRVANCMGLGLCTTCRVRVVKGSENLSRVGWLEWLMRRIHPVYWWVRIGEEEATRLACQTKVYGDCEIEAKPPMNLHGSEKFWN